ncbi:MAG: cytochrome c [Xanthobacteraceae bacterium]|nr:cytochrome c [Xanthobacteraceae bacterium]
MRLFRSLKAGCVAALMLAGFPLADGRTETLSPSAQRGRVFVQANCARCHAIGRTGDSPLPIAPAFRTLHQRYPVVSLQEALAEGIVTGHPSMPEFSLAPDQVDAVIAYLKSLER